MPIVGYEGQKPPTNGQSNVVKNSAPKIGKSLALQVIIKIAIARFVGSRQPSVPCKLFTLRQS